jgi:hypothetical protein
MRPTRRPATSGSVRAWASAAYASWVRLAGLTLARVGEGSVQTPSGKPRVPKLSGTRTT